MPSLTEITLTWFRNFEQKKISFAASVVGIAGKNGIGKTNLLDAIYYLCFTKSYFQNKERNNILLGQDGFRIDGLWKKEQVQETTTCIYRDGKKSVLQDAVPYEKISDHIGRYHAVMIAPDDLSIVNNGSDARRKFADGLLAQTNQEYLSNLLAYQKILLQKNSYLKQTLSNNLDWDLLDVYDNLLTLHGSILIEQRKQLSDFLPGKIQEYYQQLSGNNREQVALFYQCSSYKEELRTLLHQSRSYDIECRRTTKGPHTEDWLFLLNGQPLKTHASQGQKKSFLISLKLAQLAWLQQFDKSPLLLMDDIFEKLDHFRLEQLFRLLPGFRLMQLFLTHTEEEELEKLLPVYNKDFQIIKL